MFYSAWRVREWRHRERKRRMTVEYHVTLFRLERALRANGVPFERDPERILNS
jgi:hypothetical protein